MPDEVMTTLGRCATDRATVCTQLLKTSIPAGKQILNVLMNGGGVPPGMENNEFLINVQKLVRYLRRHQPIALCQSHMA